MSPRIDIHTHILPRDIPKWKEKFGYGGFVQLDHHKNCCARMLKDDGTFFREIQSNCWDPVVRASECDAAEVSQQVLSTVPVMFNYWAKPEHALETSRMLNDHIADVVMARPDRFIGLGTLPMQDSKLAIRELERCRKDLRLRGIQIGTNVNGRDLNEPAIVDILQAAQDLDACVFVHPWDMLAPERMKKYWTPWLVGMPTEITLAIMALIMGGVLDRLPRLRIAFAHGGGSFPGTFGRIQHGFEARPDLVAVDNPNPPKNYLRRFYVDSLVHDERQLRVLLEMFGPERIALGSDYPFPLGEDKPGQMIAGMNLPDDVKQWLMYKSALSWLGEKV